MSSYILCLQVALSLFGATAATTRANSNVQQPSAGACVYPATCTPPEHSTYSVVANVQSRSQWPDSDGYCGSLSVQAIALSYGNWISQDQVRKAATPGAAGCSGGDLEHGYELDTTNIASTLDALGLSHDAWDWRGAVLPQPPAYLRWLKSHLVQQEPVVWFIMCKGDSHNCSSAGNWDHIEPVWGIYSNHSLTEVDEDGSVVAYPDDVVVHGADYGALGAVEGPRLYRTLASLPDTVRMDGNCALAQAGVGKNEYYPCIPNTADYGIAITGNADESGTYTDDAARDASGTVTVGLSLAVDRFDEPDLRRLEQPAEMQATITVGAGTHPKASLVAGANYIIYRWDNGARNVPTNPSSYNTSNFTSQHPFVGSGPAYTFQDPLKIISSGSTHYRCAAF